jgi:hypothetical protein
LGRGARGWRCLGGISRENEAKGCTYAPKMKCADAQRVRNYDGPRSVAAGMYHSTRCKLGGGGSAIDTAHFCGMIEGCDAKL